MITVVDYGCGNLFSISHALSRVGAGHAIVDDPAVIGEASKILLPGVGAFGDAMRQLADRKLVDPIMAAVANGAQLLGVCVGMQMLMTHSEEFGSYDGLGLIEGSVRRLPAGTAKNIRQGLTRIPNVGWRRLGPVAPEDPLLSGAGGEMVYFLHSFAAIPESSDAVAATIHINGVDCVASVRSGRIAGVQFHPEKSGDAGLNILRRFAGS